MKSAPVPSSPPASSKPGWPGGMKCVGMSPVIGPPNAWRSASLSIAALSASPHVGVVERRPVGPERDVAEAAGRRRQLHQVLLVALRDALEDRRRQLEVAGHLRLALEDLARGDVGVVALLDRDRVDVGGLVVGRRVPVRVAHELDLGARRVAGELARLVVLDHVRTGRDLVVAVRGRLLAVELLRVLLRHRRRGRHRQRGGDDGAARGVELEDDRLVVGRLDARDLVRLAVLERLQARQGSHVGAHVRPCDLRGEAALEPVLDVGRGDLAVDRRAELHAGADLHRDGLAVLGDLRRTLRQIGLEVARVVGLVRVERALRRVRDVHAVLVVRRARVDLVDVGGVHDDQVTALLRFLLRGFAALIGRLLSVVASAPSERKDERGPQGQCDTPHQWTSPSSCAGG